MAIPDIEPAHILSAIELLDDPDEGPRLLKSLHFNEAQRFRLLCRGVFYPSKAVVGIAHQFVPGGGYLDSSQVIGGVGNPTTAASVLEDRGFFVDYGELWALQELQVDRTHGRPAPYQEVVLLWAISRARAGKPRIMPFSAVRTELAQLLRPFAIGKTPPDPVMPWIALRGPLWELDARDEPVSESAVRSRDISAGLTESVYGRVRQGDWSDEFVGGAVDVVTKRIGTEPAYLSLLERLGLARSGSLAGVGEPPEVGDAIAAVEEVSNPRRKGGRRFSAAENKAIEVHAVNLTRSYFEEQLGYATEDVGATESYDVLATNGQETVKVEVKGTTTDGAAILLTKNEVDLHVSGHPSNALAIVRNILLDRSGGQPVAAGGTLELTKPWKIDTSRLQPIAYRYPTGGESDGM
ncbi:DUF3883 domain-containing protein [Gordonia sp. LSe1-13]|uniref:DUF3883 domain-containing protein n=1 Tax=Gordonia sesuvii TaxID=3116777 RepID=A0ABU7MI36_9ACTN|nr:DUF3883 domain-containing protein [Gordonia sp. LSe1-13]